MEESPSIDALRQNEREGRKSNPREYSIINDMTERGRKCVVQFTFLRLEENWNDEEGKCSFLGGNRQEVGLKMDSLDLATNACHAKWAREKIACLP